jgi:hypothetical protein
VINIPKMIVSTNEREVRARHHASGTPHRVAIAIPPLAFRLLVRRLVSMLSVLVVSQDSRFLDCVDHALQGEGMRAVSLHDAAMEMAEKGFRPRAIVVDPLVLLEPGGGELVGCLAGSPALAAVPILSISSAAQRVEIAELLDTLRRLEEGGEHAYG